MSCYLITHLPNVPALLLRLIEVSETVGLGKLTRGAAASALAPTESSHHLVQLKITKLSKCLQLRVSSFVSFKVCRLPTV